MNKPPVNFEQGDDLSDFLGQPSQGARPLPQDDASVRIRQSAPAFEESCRKCGGTGTFRSYSGRSLGPCFACKGKGKFAFKSSPEVREQGRQYRASLPGKRWDAFQASYPAEAAWILKTAQTAQGGFRDVVLGIKDAVDRYGDLSDGRMRVVQGGLARDAQRAVPAAIVARQAVPPAPAAQYPKIRAFLLKAKEAGLKAPGFGGKGIALEMAKDHSRNPGCVYVKWQGEYAGKIGSDGAFYVLRAFEGNAELAERLATIEADPAAWTKLVGIETGSCACCGLTLTDPVSIARGIGPICWGKWGF